MARILKKLDTDGDQLSDGVELADGSNPLDRGSYYPLLSRLPFSTIRLGWNSFFDMWNVQENYSTSTSVTKSTLQVLGQSGKVFDHFPLSLSPSSPQFDVLVHATNHPTNSYGDLYTTITEGEPSAIRTSMIFYKPRHHAEGFEFAIASVGALDTPGAKTLMNNTYQPSLAPGDADDLVAVWARLSTNSQQKEHGALKFYGQNGDVS